MFAGDTQCGATGRQDGQPRTRRQQLYYERRGLEHVLDIVQHQQHFNAANGAHQQRLQRIPPCFSHAKRLGDRRDDEIRITNGG